MTRPTKSLATRLNQAGLLINNALANPAIIKELNAYNFHEECFLNLKEQFEKVISLTEKQKKEYGDQFQATAAVEEARAVADNAYKKSLKIARIAFRNHPAAASALLLDGNRKASVSGFLEQSRTFYNNLLADDKMVAEMANYNCNREKLTAEKEQVARVSAAFENQQKERGEALQATKERDAVLDQFEQQVADLVTICKIAFEERPDVLTALGI